ncbi:hypothetical protein MMC29_005495 [Sticta canariensis]|nr:hypothetical protein [Sticta canariensis]
MSVLILQLHLKPIPPKRLQRLLAPRHSTGLIKFLSEPKEGSFLCNFNPLLVGELFGEQLSKWRHLAIHHVEEVEQVCNRFLNVLQKTDTIQARHQARDKDSLAKCMADATTKISAEDDEEDGVPHNTTNADVARVLAIYAEDREPNMENYSCEEALDCVFLSTRSV